MAALSAAVCICRFVARRYPTSIASPTMPRITGIARSAKTKDCPLSTLRLIITPPLSSYKSNEIAVESVFGTLKAT
jgi:hypothetical protein